jgi:hypothetical protein
MTTPKTRSHTPDNLMTEGHDQALRLLRQCATADGFLASLTDHDNYRRIWARDGVITGLAALLTDESDLINTFKQTLLTLARYQGPHGEIPSNVDTVSERVSYGGTTGRIDADLWFVIGCTEYWAVTEDNEFIHEMFPCLEKVRQLLGAWEFNNRGLIYVPPAGDWADEYLHSGYVLYDQLLYLQAQRCFCAIHHHIHDSLDHQLIDRKNHLRHLIMANYWFPDHEDIPDDVYHEVLYCKGFLASPHCAGKYWLPFFSPTGYGYRFDSLANVLVSLFDVADDEQRLAVDDFINGIVSKKLPLLPAFFPVIEPLDEDWKELQMTFSYSFKNKPYEFQNGGLWSMISGFYVADLAQRGKTDEAEKYLTAIHQANMLAEEDGQWGFYEYQHGKTLQVGGMPHQAWSAAGALIGHYALQHKKIFQIDGIQ